MTAPVKHHGLINQGATCYLNSLLQVLFMTREFREAVNRPTHSLDQHLRDLFDELQQQTASTHTFTTKLGISRVCEDDDVAECFLEILKQISPDTSQVFRGQLTHKTKCSKCQTVINKESHFWLLPLKLMDSNCETYSVVDGIEDYFRDSHFSGLDQMYCEDCDGKVDATVKCEVKHHPEVLVLLLKRFDFDYNYMRYVKNNRAVTVDFTLHIPENQTYELYAVVDHVGDLSGGHYTATVKNQDEDRWYNFNDERVSPSRPFQLKNSKTAYLLFYKRRHKMSDSQKTLIKIIKNKPRGVKKRTYLPMRVRLFICLLIIVIILMILSGLL